VEKKFIFLIGVALGAILCSVAVWFLVVRPSQRTIEDYRAKQLILEDTNRALGKSVADREADVGRLAGIVAGLRSENSRAREDYRKLDEANRVRQGIIESARVATEATDDAISKLVIIIDAFEKLEQGLHH
jgi:cbb3-type cytochrome oxidase subunit 3